MTREEAIRYLIRPILTSTVSSNEYIKQVDALNMAIEALSKPEIVRCKDCVYYDPPHINDHGERREYKDMPAEAFDKLGTGLVNMSYGINVGGRCLRDYNAGYSDDKRIFVPETNYCGRAKRRTK